MHNKRKTDSSIQHCNNGICESLVQHHWIHFVNIEESRANLVKKIFY